MGKLNAAIRALQRSRTAQREPDPRPGRAYWARFALALGIRITTWLVIERHVN